MYATPPSNEEQGHWHRKHCEVLGQLPDTCSLWVVLPGTRPYVLTLEATPINFSHKGCKSLNTTKIYRTEVAQNSFQCKRFSLLGNHILYSSTAPFYRKKYMPHRQGSI